MERHVSYFNSYVFHMPTVYGTQKGQHSVTMRINSVATMQASLETTQSCVVMMGIYL